MNTISYFIEANIALAVVAIFYHATLRNETNFQFQRIFIIGGVLCSLSFPLIQVKIGSDLPSMPGLIAYTLPELTVNEYLTVFEFKNVLTTVYEIISVLILIRLVWNFSRLLKLWSATKLNNTNGRSEKGSFSFLNLIFIEHSISPEDKEMILKHEQVHAKLFHSADILLIELLKVAFWFNPFVYLLRKQITNIHEFQADELVVKDNNAEQYCNLLARVALKSADFPIANHFNNSLTLKRIIMITQEKAKLSRWKVLASGAVMVALFIFISCNEQQSLNGDAASVQNSNAARSGEVFTNVQESATPADGMKVLYEGIAQSLEYPAEAREKGVQGKVFVQFVVNTDGTTSDATVLRGIGSGCDEAALKAVVDSKVKWTPGKQDGKDVRQQMTLPINFQLDGGYPENKNSSATDPNQKQMDEMVAVGKRN